MKSHHVISTEKAMKRLVGFIVITLIILAMLAACSPATAMATSTQTALPSATASPSPMLEPTARPNVLYVDPSKDFGPISPYVYGSNYGPWTAIPAGMTQLAFDSHITAIRWPGGRWGNENDIQTYQLDMFIAICKKIGAIPTISVRYQDSTPAVAAALVHYANIQQGYHIVYWSIGNEPDFELLDGKRIDPVAFAKQWRAIALAMKAVDPSIKLMGPELSQWGADISKTAKYPPIPTPATQERQDWMTDFLKANGDLVDVVDVHRYPVYSASSKTPITADTLRQNTLEWDGLVTYLRELIHQITGRDIPIAFTEVNSDPSNVVGGVASPDSFYNAIWYADVLGRLIDQNVFMVNNFALSGTGGLGLLYPGQVRPTYYVFQMYHQFGSERVYSSSGVSFVTVYASKRADGTLTIMVINLTDNQQQVPLQIQGMQPAQAEVWLFDATHNAVDLGQQAMPADGKLVLPAQSITLFAIGGK
jgi:hypothetical protein